MTPLDLSSKCDLKFDVRFIEEPGKTLDDTFIKGSKV